MPLKRQNKHLNRQRNIVGENDQTSPVNPAANALATANRLIIQSILEPRRHLESIREFALDNANTLHVETVDAASQPSERADDSRGVCRVQGDALQQCG